MEKEELGIYHQLGGLDLILLVILDNCHIKERLMENLENLLMGNLLMENLLKGIHLMGNCLMENLLKGIHLMGIHQLGHLRKHHLILREQS